MIREVGLFIVKCVPGLIPDEWVENLLRKYLLGNQQGVSSIKGEKTLEIIQVLIVKKL